jgi:hypothetical protein
MVETCAKTLHDGLIADTTALIHTATNQTLGHVQGIREEMTQLDHSMTNLNGQYDTIGDRMLALEEAVSTQLYNASERSQTGLREMLKSVVAGKQTNPCSVS